MTNISSERIIPINGKNPYADHPGFDAGNCPLRYTVTRTGCYGGVIGGFGCEMTGGHCLPSERCDKLREDARIQDEMRAMIEQCERENIPKYPLTGF